MRKVLRTQIVLSFANIQLWHIIKLHFNLIYWRCRKFNLVVEWIGAPVQDVVCGLPCTSNDDDDLRVLQEKSCVSCRFWCCKYINHHKSHDLNPFLTMSAFLTMFCQPFASVNFSYFKFCEDWIRSEPAGYSVSNRIYRSAYFINFFL